MQINLVDIIIENKDELIFFLPIVDKSKIALDEEGDEAKAYLIGGVIFLLETLLIGGFILLRLWKYHRHLSRKRLSSARQEQRKNLESLMDYNAVQQSEE